MVSIHSNKKKYILRLAGLLLLLLLLLVFFLFYFLFFLLYSGSSHILQLRTYSAFIDSDIVLASTSDATCVVGSVTSFSHLRYIVFRKSKTMLLWSS
jgi:hypothetical protein